MITYAEISFNAECEHCGHEFGMSAGVKNWYPITVENIYCPKCGKKLKQDKRNKQYKSDLSDEKMQEFIEFQRKALEKAFGVKIPKESEGTK